MTYFDYSLMAYCNAVGAFLFAAKSTDSDFLKSKSEDLFMQKFNLKVSKKNGDEITVAVYLDEITAKLLQQSGDQKIIDAYLYE